MNLDEAARHYGARTQILLRQEAVDFSRPLGREKGRKFDRPGVYAICSRSTGEPVYIGKATNLRERFNQHRHGSMRSSAFRRSLSEKLGTRSELKLNDHIARSYLSKSLPLKDPREMTRLEHFAIAVVNPPLNKPFDTDKPCP
jgi:predicted GIY-YIG superfamily endonuclease